MTGFAENKYIVNLKNFITFPLKRILLDSLHCCSIPPKFGCLGDYNTRLLAP